MSASEKRSPRINPPFQARLPPSGGDLNTQSRPSPPRALPHNVGRSRAGESPSWSSSSRVRNSTIHPPAAYGKVGAERASCRRPRSDSVRLGAFRPRVSPACIDHAGDLLLGESVKASVCVSPSAVRWGAIGSCPSSSATHRGERAGGIGAPKLNGTQSQSRPLRVLIRDHPHQITPGSVPRYASPRRIVPECSPSLGAGPAIALGVWLNCAAGRACRTSPKPS